LPPLPKRKYAKARQGERRAHLHLEPVGLTDCPQCHQPRLPHRACPSCGYYKGEAVVELKTKKPRT
jgi:large subunit ribosomal protein L32